MIKDVRLERLPKWAQEEMANLRRRVESLQARLAVLDDNEETAVSHGGYTSKRRFIPDADHVSFATEHGEIEVGLNVGRDGIRVSGGAAVLRVTPQAANSIFVDCKRSW